MCRGASFSFTSWGFSPSLRKSLFCKGALVISHVEVVPPRMAFTGLQPAQTSSEAEVSQRDDVAFLRSVHGPGAEFHSPEPEGSIWSPRLQKMK